MLKFAHPVLLATLVALAPFTDAAEQSRTVPEFKSIVSKGAFKLAVDVGQAQSIKIRADNRNLDWVRTEVVGNELILSYKHKSTWSSEDNVEITIGAPILQKFRLAGAGATEITHVQGDKFELVSEGAGLIKVSGKVKNLSLTAKGVGMVDTRDLYAEIADVALNGVGAVEVRASDSLNASVNGIGSLTYYGNPAHINKSVNGLGHVGSGK